MTPAEPLRWGCVGLGNYAGYIAHLLLEHTRRSERSIRLQAVFDPQPGRAPALVDQLRAAGVRVVERYDDLLSESIEAVWLPVPIALHEQMTIRALRAGKAVMVEKPAAGTVDEIDRMISARDASGRPVAVGFQDLGDPVIWSLKRRLMAGEIGKIRRVAVFGASARGETYYGRSPWAGKLRDDHGWVLDGPAQNAEAHAIHLAMFLAGTDLIRSALPCLLNAELYRSNPIESFDTCSIRFDLDTGAEALILLTHACEFFIDARVDLIGDRGRLTIVRDVAVLESDGREEVIRRTTPSRDHLVERFSALVRGDCSGDGLATLETARSQVAIVNAAIQATPIFDIPDSAVRRVKCISGPVRAVIGMEAMMALCGHRFKGMHESELFPWTTPPRRIDASGYSSFPGPHRDDSPTSTRAIT